MAEHYFRETWDVAGNLRKLVSVALHCVCGSITVRSAAEFSGSVQCPSCHILCKNTGEAQEPKPDRSIRAPAFQRLVQGIGDPAECARLDEEDRRKQLAEDQANGVVHCKSCFRLVPVGDFESHKKSHE